MLQWLPDSARQQFHTDIAPGECHPRLHQQRWGQAGLRHQRWGHAGLRRQHIRHWCARIAVAMLVVCTVPVQATWAQPKIVVDASQPTCKGCTLTFTKIATLGSVNDPEFAGTIALSSGLAMDSKGRFFATELGATKILVYSPNGKYQESFGQKGNGPGEFKQALKISIGAGDSIYVVSPLQVLTFSPQLKFVRSVPIALEGPQYVAPLIMKGGEFILPKTPLRNDPAQFLRIAPTGETKSFGVWSPEAIRCMLCGRQIIGVGTGASEFWAMPSNAYELEEWGADLRVVRHLSIANSTWFRAWGAEAGYGGPEIKPKATFMGLFPDRTGLVWVEGHGPIANWTTHPDLWPPGSRSGLRGPLNLPVGGGKVPSAEILKRTITYIDVFDPANGKLFFAQAFIGRQLRMISSELIGELREDADGIPVWDIFKVAIKRP